MSLKKALLKEVDEHSIDVATIMDGLDEDDGAVEIGHEAWDAAVTVMNKELSRILPVIMRAHGMEMAPGAIDDQHFYFEIGMEAQGIFKAYIEACVTEAIEQATKTVRASKV